MKLMILPTLTLLIGFAYLAGQHAALMGRVMVHSARSDGDVVGPWQPNRGVTAGQRGYREADETRRVVVSSGWLRAEFEEGRSAGGQPFRLTDTPVKVTGMLRGCAVAFLVTAFVAAGALAIVWRRTPREPVREHVTTISSVPKVQFQPEWKELLKCTMEGKTFAVELTMGVPTVYFSAWEATAPAWAKAQWERAKADLSVWCLQETVRLVINDKAWVEFE